MCHRQGGCVLVWSAHCDGSAHDNRQQPESSLHVDAVALLLMLLLALRLWVPCVQLEQLQRERQAEIEASEATLAALKDQVTGVLNRYLSKDIDLQVALQEMQALGIELVPLDTQDSRCVTRQSGNLTSGCPPTCKSCYVCTTKLMPS